MRCLKEGRHCEYCVHCEDVHGLEQGLLICRNGRGFGGLWHAVRAGDGCGRFKLAAKRPGRLGEGVRAVPLSRGKFALVDKGDYVRVMRHSWYAAFSLQGEVEAWYAVRKEKGKTIRMHREIMGAACGLVVDHINHDGLDNRRCNLRVCTHRENVRNQRGQRGRSSRYKGVSRDKRLGKWRAQIWHDGRHTYLGVYGSETAAARAYDAAARALFGDFAYLNFR